MPPKKVAKPAAKSKATTAKKKAAPDKAAKAKPAAKARPAASSSSSSAAAAEFKERLARAEEAARRAAALESQLAGLEGELEQERNDRLAALQRMTELEERLAESAAAAGGAPSPVVEDEQRSAFLEQERDALREELEQERQAHARTRDRLEAAETTTHDTSEHDRRLHEQIAQLQHELAQREQEIRELERPSEDLTCPRCRGQMVEFVHLGVTLDRCNDCAGLFFDAGELQEVIKREYPDPEPQEPIVVAAEVVVPEEAPKRKGFFRSLFGRKEPKEA